MRITSYIIASLVIMTIGVFLVQYGWRGEGWMMRSDSTIAIDLPFMVGPLLYLVFIEMIIVGLIFIVTAPFLFLIDKEMRNEN